MKRIVPALLALLLPVLPAAAAEVESGSVYCFSPGDFSEETITGICVTAVPESGSILLGGREIRSGDILTVGQVAQMTYAPGKTQTDQEAVMTYLPIYPDRVEAAATMAIQVIGKQDLAPVAEDSGIETYKNLPNEGRLKAEDPEGETLTFTVTRQPRRGTVTIRDDGSFVFEPKKNKVGVDSFTYTASDPAGNVSREATVTITILKPTEATLYTDTAGRSCRFAAEWMKNTGIFTGETVSGNSCFGPDKTVSRGEFLTMMVSALELSVDDTATQTGYTDETADWLKPYLAAAMRSGLTAGWPDGTIFGADQTITGAEAAVMLQNALDLTLPADAQTDSDIPVWAADAITVLGTNGISLTTDNLTRARAAEILYQASRLAEDAPGLRVLRAAR
ncbi:MAG: S-layer homology domain-containing protein [Oscillospiraceae bacterium]|nr:S-layer homology domain-containing protein [Oscillospiraceae bacterium]